MDKKVSYLSHKWADGSRWTVEQMLADALAEVTGQRVTPRKALVLFLDDTDGQCDVGFRQAGLTMSQGLALTNVAQAIRASSRWTRDHGNVSAGGGVVKFDRSVPKYGGDTIGQLNPQLARCLPNDVIVLPRVEMNLF